MKNNNFLDFRLSFLIAVLLLNSSSASASGIRKIFGGSSKSRSESQNFDEDKKRIKTLRKLDKTEKERLKALEKAKEDAEEEAEEAENTKALNETLRAREGGENCAESIDRKPVSDSVCDPKGNLRNRPLAANEPKFCTFQGLMESEDKTRDCNLINFGRARAFRFGTKTIVGYAVGATNNNSADLGRGLPVAFGANNELSPEQWNSEQFKSCTMYYNDNSEAAANAFNYCPIGPRPDMNNVADIMRKIETGGQIDPVTNRKECEGDISKWKQCLQSANFLALGCQGQRHRGPTLFGMLLTAAGCSPEHAAFSSCKLWGLNGISQDARIKANQLMQSYIQKPVSNVRGAETRLAEFQRILGITTGANDGSPAAPTAVSSNVRR